jgi:hypothetical protein
MAFTLKLEHADDNPADPPGGGTRIDQTLWVQKIRHRGRGRRQALARDLGGAAGLMVLSDRGTDFDCQLRRQGRLDKSSRQPKIEVACCPAWLGDGRRAA